MFRLYPPASKTSNFSIILLYKKKPIFFVQNPEFRIYWDHILVLVLSDSPLRSSLWRPELHAFLSLGAQLRQHRLAPPPQSRAAQCHHLLRGRQHGVRQLGQSGPRPEEPLVPAGLHGSEQPALRPGSGLHALPASLAGPPGPLRPQELHGRPGRRSITLGKYNFLLPGRWVLCVDGWFDHLLF